MSFNLSASELPTIDRAGNFPLLNPVFEFAYRNPTHALHMYDYAGKIRIGSKEYRFKPGDITCIQSGSVYSLATDSPGKHWCIHFNDDLVKGKPTITLPQLIQLGANSLFYLEQIRLISRLHYNTQPYDENNPMELEARFRLKALLLALHNHCSGQTRLRRSRSNFSLDRLLSWIDENLERPISHALLAEQVNVSPGTLAKQFKQSQNCTLSQHLLHRRIDKAKSLLATSSLTIYEVGSAVGIPDPQYFNKQFRKTTGISPSHYRDDNQDYLSNVSDEVAVKEGQWQDDPSGGD